jgi:fatty-acyl-CoA synthase
MTEASGLLAIDPPAGPGVLGSVGFPLPYTQLVVRRLNTDGSPGTACSPGEVGIVTLRGPTVSPGYRTPEHDRGVFVDGMLNTGDLGYVDDTGRVHIAGRTKDLIIRGGHNIDPLMIENAMQRHPAVALAAAVGMPDAYAGELPVCYVALRPGAAVTEADLHAHAEAAIAERPAWPKHIFVIDTIPVTSVGKIYKPTLRCHAAARLVTRLLREELGIADAEVRATEGGPRGMTVSVRLPESDASVAPRVRDALGAFLFEVEVTDYGDEFLN